MSMTDSKTLLDQIKVLQTRKNNINALLTILNKPINIADEINALEFNIIGYKIVSKNTNLLEFWKNAGIKWAPPCAILLDYKFFQNLFFGIVIKFPSSIVQMNLPENIKKELSKYNISPDNIDIFFHAQDMSFLGESDFHKDGSPPTTLLRAHFWADPDMPDKFLGWRLNRKFLLGLFDGDDLTIANQIEFNKMKPFDIQVHDSTLSPRNGILNLPKTPQSFWSLAIDNQPPSGKPLRALVTLHWLFDNNDQSMKKLKFQLITLEKITTFGKLFSFMQAHHNIKTQSFVKKLGDLVGHQ